MQVGAHITLNHGDAPRPRGYVLDGIPTAVVDFDGAYLFASGPDFARKVDELISALRTAVAQARIAQQDADLADLAGVA